jgi:pyrroline-5-carboxylate reductase
MSDSLLLVGGGKMGSALLSGWLTRGIAPGSVHVVEPNAEAAAHYAASGVSVGASADSIPASAQPQTVLFAVKPQVMEAVVPAYRRFASRALFISIAAGRPIAFFEKHLGADSAVVRVMPNTPAAVGRGISVAVANRAVTASQRARAGALLEAVGEVAWVEDESLMDAVTAVSGSGPAYVFLLAECLAEAGIAAGLAPQLATQLARATVSGSGELLHQAKEETAVLRRNVTSPGGTTEAALKVLMDEPGLKDLMKRAIDAAARRSRELAG